MIDQLIRARRKSVSLTVTREGKLVVRAPLQLPRAQVEQIVAQRADWIAAKRAHMAQLRESRPTRSYLPGERFPVQGRLCELRVKAGERYISLVGDTILAPPLPPEAMRDALEALYRVYARRVFQARVQVFASQMGVQCSAVRLSSAKTRWGSCSNKGSINLVWRLVLAPPEILDYVIVHELCHIRHLDHSAAFWELVAQYCPDWRAHRSWLMENGETLSL